MKLAQHILALTACALIAMMGAVMYVKLFPPSLDGAWMWSEIEFMAYQDKQNHAWFIIFSVLCFIWFFWSLRTKND